MIFSRSTLGFVDGGLICSILTAVFVTGLSACGADKPASPFADNNLPDRWQLDAPRHVITWDVTKDARLPHADRVEMSGKRTSAIISYKINAQRELEMSKTLIWPGLRIAPNDTHSSLKIDFSESQPPRGRETLDAKGLERFEPIIKIDGKPVTPVVRQVRFETGLLIITSDLGNTLTLKQTFTPGVENAGYFEFWEITAEHATANKEIEITPIAYSAKLHYKYSEKSVYYYGKPRKPAILREGDYRIAITCAGATGRTLKGVSGKVCEAGVLYSADYATDLPLKPDFQTELNKRAAFARARFADLRFECPDPVLENLFDYSKIRACDSICQTKHGPMHAPGGGAYYAAIWANDTIEYVGPFYPFLGYQYGNMATLNAMGQFARYLNPEYNPLPSSIIAEGTDIWARRLKADGLPDWEGDRGDAAMIAYGYSRFLLAYGDKKEARKFWPAIEWALEYCHRHTTADGVIESASDELEGRFSSGKCNLNTSMLTYGGLRSAADLAEELGKTELAQTYRERSEALHKAVRKYFEANVDGFATYRYHEGCKELRAWICIPLTMRIMDRKQGTIDALFSPQLWTGNGILTAEGSTTFWDRSTLYALRGVFNAGEPDRALEYLQKFSRCRLLGEHVPYVVEAYPEGNGRHLSAESALYCRVITEGLFGITPTGFRSFTMNPSLPTAWNHMALRRVKAFHSTFDVEVTRQNDGQLKITYTLENKKPVDVIIKAGETAKIQLDGRKNE